MSNLGAGYNRFTSPQLTWLC